MGLDVLIQMDPIDGIDVEGDTSFAMLLEAQRRGHRISWYQAWQLSLCDGCLWTRAAPLQLRDEVGHHFIADAAEQREVASADVVLMRQDPPFDMGYLSGTYLLESVCEQVLVVNHPTAVRNAPEKLLVMQFPDFMPPTLVTADADEIRAFHAEHGDVIVKPLYGNGGAGVFRILENGENLNVLLDMHFEHHGKQPMVVQKFLAAIQKGDKRILLLDGYPVGAIVRFPPPGEVRANMHVGGKAEATHLNKRDEEICDAIGGELRRRGLLFAGIDVIDGCLIEINVTSPTGMREVERFGGGNMAGMFWDLVEERVG